MTPGEGSLHDVGSEETGAPENKQVQLAAGGCGRSPLGRRGGRAHRQPGSERRPEEFSPGLRHLGSPEGTVGLITAMG